MRTISGAEQPIQEIGQRIDVNEKEFAKPEDTNVEELVNFAKDGQNVKSFIDNISDPEKIKQLYFEATRQYAQETDDSALDALENITDLLKEKMREGKKGESNKTETAEQTKSEAPEKSPDNVVPFKRPEAKLEITPQQQELKLQLDAANRQLIDQYADFIRINIAGSGGFKGATEKLAGTLERISQQMGEDTKWMSGSETQKNLKLVLDKLKDQVALAKTVIERDKTKVDLAAQGSVMKARELLESLQAKLADQKEGMEKAA